MIEKFNNEMTEGIPCDNEVVCEFNSIVNEIKQCFREKNLQYGTEDPLANFTKGAELLIRKKDTPEELESMQYEALKSYVAKHIAHVYNNGIHGHRVKESWNDIAVYAIIAMLLINRLNERECLLTSSLPNYQIKKNYAE